MREFIWYVEPAGCVVTNKILVEHLGGDGECKGKLCADGLEHDLWRCDREFITELERARKRLSLTFKVYVQEGEHGQVRLWKFGKKKKKRHVPQVQEATMV